MRALLYLSVHRWLNSLKRIPRNPRLLFPVLFFAGLIALQLTPFLLESHGVTPRRHRHKFVPPGLVGIPPQYGAGWAMTEGVPGGFIFGVRALLLLSLFSSVIVALGEGNLFFESADIDFLFPAPFRRRTVLLIRMLARYGALLVPAVYLPTVLGGLNVTLEAGVSPLRLVPGMVGAWLFLVASANFAQASVISRSDRDDEKDATDGELLERRRNRIRTVVGVVLTLLLVGGAVYLLPLLTAEGGVRGDRAWHTLLRVGNGRLMTAVLAPVAWAADLFRVPVEGWTWAATARMAGLVALAAASFVALFARDRDFYDNAITVTVRRLNARAALRGGDPGALLSQMAQEGKLARGHALPTFGGGARALTWRNLTAVTRTPPRTWINLLVLAVLPAVITLLIGRQRTDAGVLIWTVTFALQMSGIFLVDLRAMLRRADLSKSLPIAPLAFLLGELAAPVLQLTLLGYLSLTILALAGSGHGPLLVVAYAVFPSVATLLLLVQTAFVLLYPQQNDAAQQAIGNLLGLIVSVCAIAPAVVTGLLLALVFRAPPLALAAGIAMVNLLASGVMLLVDAALWTRYDPTD